MKEQYNKGIAFICEGDTEKEFYLSLMHYLCNRHHAVICRKLDDRISGIAYELQTENAFYILKFHVAESITGITKSGKWFEAECTGRHLQIPWMVYLCYDTDAYEKDITVFYEGDWTDLRSKLKEAEEIIDLAAAADIEDVMMMDMEGICQFLEHPLVSKEEVAGRKGTAKMKRLFRECGKSYHKGSRARAMIDSLNMQRIMDSGILPLRELERRFFYKPYDV